MPFTSVLRGPGIIPVFGTGTTSSSSSATDPQLLWFDPWHRRTNAGLAAYSNGTVSVQYVNLPLSLQLSRVELLYRASGSGTRTVQWGLYSLNGSSLSLANSASQSITPNGGTGTSWVSLVISAAQNIAPGPWWFAINVLSGGTSSFSLAMNSSANPANAGPFPTRGRMTVSTNAMPGSIATSDLDITGNDAVRQPYMILTA